MTSSVACVEPDADPYCAILTPDQESALRQIAQYEKPGGRFLLTGHAGSGKTFLMQRLAENALRRRKRIVLSAPTHKAVGVLARKMNEAFIDVPCVTVHRLLSLTPRPQGDKQVFQRERNALPVDADIVVVDECSMISEDLFKHIELHLPRAYVVFVGDPAQLPPVGEVSSKSFLTESHAHLTTIVRQAAGNPILEAADMIRASQGYGADWSWCKPRSTPEGHGVFVPRDTHQWIRKAFTSDEFENDPDNFRYLAWTNKRVEQINNLVRQWRYGDNIPTPFVPGEMAMFRAPVIIGDQAIFSTNEEALVVSIESDSVNCTLPKLQRLDGWEVAVRVWRITLAKADGTTRSVCMPASAADFNAITERIKAEANQSWVRWKNLHDLKSEFANLQSIYAMTVHVSQGSTLTNVFCDVADIRKRAGSNLLEMQQMAYVAATRASHRLILVGT